MVGAGEFGWNTRACGSDLKCALIPLSVNLIAWADDIVFMSRENYLESVILFSDGEYSDEIKRKHYILEVPDIYDRDDTRLICDIRDKLIALNLPDATSNYSPD